MKRKKNIKAETFEANAIMSRQTGYVMETGISRLYTKTKAARRLLGLSSPDYLIIPVRITPIRRKRSK